MRQSGAEGSRTSPEGGRKKKEKEKTFLKVHGNGVRKMGGGVPSVKKEECPPNVGKKGGLGDASIWTPCTEE